MAMTWTTLTGAKSVDGSIKNYINHDKIPSDVIVNEAESLILQRFRHISMRKLATGTVLDGQTSLDISSLRVLSIKTFWWNTTSAGDSRKMKVTLRQPEMFEMALSIDPDTTLPHDGLPTDMTYDRSTIYFNNTMDEDTSYRMWYYERPNPLSASNDTNILTDDFPHILRAATNARAYAWRKDEAREEKELVKLNAMVDLALVDSDMADESAEYNMYWNQDGSGNFINQF